MLTFFNNYKNYKSCRKFSTKFKDIAMKYKQFNQKSIMFDKNSYIQECYKGEYTNIRGEENCAVRFSQFSGEQA